MRRPWSQLRAAFVLSLVLLVSPLELVEVHGPAGQSYWLNAREISALRQPTQAELSRFFTKGTHCIISVTNGRFVAVTETCQEVRDKLAGGRLK